jgi:hypothetical protein
MKMLTYLNVARLASQGSPDSPSTDPIVGTGASGPR